MGKTINVDFVKLEEEIGKLKKLQGQLKEPKISDKYDMLNKSSKGKGNVLDRIFDMRSRTKEYYQAVNSLLDNTISYLQNTKETLQTTDASIGTVISKEG